MKNSLLGGSSVLTLAEVEHILKAKIDHAAKHDISSFELAPLALLRDVIELFGKAHAVRGDEYTELLLLIQVNK